MIPTTSESEGCFASVPDKEIAKWKRSYDLPHPSKRTKEQHLLTADMMRDRKTMMTSRRAMQQSEEQASNAIALLRDSVFLLGARKSSRSEASLALRVRIVADSFQPQPPSIPGVSLVRTFSNAWLGPSEWDFRRKKSAFMGVWNRTPCRKTLAKPTGDEKTTVRVGKCPFSDLFLESTVDHTVPKESVF